MAVGGWGSGKEAADGFAFILEMEPNGPSGG